MTLQPKVGIALSLLLTVTVSLLALDRHFVQNSLQDLRNAPPEKAARMVSDFSQSEEISGRMSRGMSKDEISRLLPPPQNKDTENVWIWVFDYGAKRPSDNDWRSLVNLPGDSCFIVFTNGGLATSICAESAFEDPWVALQSCAGISVEDAEKILGKRNSSKPEQEQK